MAEEKSHSALDLLKEVIELMEEHELAEVRLSERGVSIHVKRQGGELVPLVSPSLGTSHPLVTPESTTHALPSEEHSEQFEVIRSPMLGTFYRAPEPDQPPFVEPGSRVSAGDTLCLIEAMKVFTDLKAEFDCEIIAVLVEDSQPVEYDQPLFRVRRL